MGRWAIFPDREERIAERTIIEFNRARAALGGSAHRRFGILICRLIESLVVIPYLITCTLYQAGDCVKA